MRTILIILVAALLTVPAISQTTQVSGDFGKAWINQSGTNKAADQTSNPGLWSWGATPKGRTLSNGKLMPETPGMVIYPAFPTNTIPIIINATTASEAVSGNNSSQVNNPYISDDPWYIAQSSDRPVFFGIRPY